MKQEYDIRKLLSVMEKNYEIALINLIRHPERRKEWQIYVPVPGAEGSMVFYKNDCMDDVYWLLLAHTMSSVFNAYATGHETTANFRLENLDYFLELGEYGIEQVKDKFGANELKGIFYQSAARAYARMGCREKESEMAALALEWFDWQDNPTPKSHKRTNFHKAYVDAEKGVTDAQFFLFECYNDGTNVRKNETLASIWLSIAAMNGDAEAQEICRDSGIDYRRYWIDNFHFLTPIAKLD